MLLHMHKMPGLEILFSLVCFPVSTSGLGTGLGFTPEAHKVLQIGAKHEGRGQEMAARESDASRVQRVIIYVPKMSLAGPVSGTTDQSTESCFMLREWDSSNKTCTHGWNF